MNIKKEMFSIQRGKSNHIIWREGQQELICNLYVQEKWSINKISREFDNLHYETIKKILLKNNIQIRSRSQAKIVYLKNSNYFNSINSHEKAYWYGFLAADGFVGRKIDGTGTNIISLTSKDKDIIEKFKNSIEYTGHIIKDKNYYKISFQDKQMAIDLVLLGVYNNKSLNLKPPTINKEYEYDFIRGYFDGDGGVNVAKNNNRIQMYFTGTYEMISWIKEHFNTKSKIRQEHRCSNNTYRLQMNGTNLCKENFDLMYKTSLKSTRMDRKYNIFSTYFTGRFNK